MKVSAFIATSLDGFIARKNGDIDWLTAAGSPGDTEDYGYKAFSDSIDCMVMGRNSLEKVLSFNKWPYEGKRVIVLSNTLKEVPPQVAGKAELYSGSLQPLIDKLDAEGYKRLYIDGGRTIQSFIHQALMTDLTITKIPVLLGEGLPLFGKTGHDIKLKHVKTKTYPSGFIQSGYEF